MKAAGREGGGGGVRLAPSGEGAKRRRREAGTAHTCSTTLAEGADHWEKA